MLSLYIILIILLSCLFICVGALLGLSTNRDVNIAQKKLIEALQDYIVTLKK